MCMWLASLEPRAAMWLIWHAWFYVCGGVMGLGHSRSLTYTPTISGQLGVTRLGKLLFQALRSKGDQAHPGHDLEVDSSLHVAMEPRECFKKQKTKTARFHACGWEWK